MLLPSYSDKRCFMEDEKTSKDYAQGKSIFIEETRAIERQTKNIFKYGYGIKISKIKEVLSQMYGLRDPSLVRISGLELRALGAESLPFVKYSLYHKAGTINDKIALCELGIGSRR